MRLCISYCLVQSICGCNLWRCPHWSSYPPICWLGKHHHNISRISPRFTSVNSVRRPFRMAKKMVGPGLADVTFVFLEDVPFKGDSERLAFCHEPTAFGIIGQCPPSNQVNLGLEEQIFTPKTKQRIMRKGRQLFLERSHVLMFSWHFGRVCFTEKAHG